MGGTSAISDVSMRGTGRLVLVESCNNVMMDVKEPEKQGGVGGEGEVLRLTDKSEDVADFQDLTQKLEVKTEDFMVKFQEISHKLSDLMEGQKKILECQNFIKTFQDQMEALQEQVRELQVNLLKDHLTVHSAGSSNSLLGVKQEITFKPQDQVFQTPRKTIEQPLRHDVTPVSICSDSDHQPAGKMMMNSRRSLVFPKSLEAMLENKENCGRTNTRMTPRHPLNDGPVPKLSLVGEVRNDAGTDDSPRRDSNLGLLVLADAALTRTPDQSAFFQGSKEAFSESDSGRSSGGSSTSSPSVSQEELKVKAAEKFARAGVYSHPGTHGSLLTKHGKTEFSSACSTDTKTRKRRKVKEPLPCYFCGKCFNNQSSLRQHESFHRPLRPFKCENENCDKAYKTRSELNRHLVVHSGEKKHECKLCGKRFLRKQYLKTHLLRHHETGIAMVAPSAIDNFRDDSRGTIPNIVVSSSLVCKTEPLTWRCQMCFKIFVTNEDLTRHVRSYHERKKLIVDEKMDTDVNIKSSIEGIKLEIDS